VATFRRIPFLGMIQLSQFCNLAHFSNIHQFVRCLEQQEQYIPVEVEELKSFLEKLWILEINLRLQLLYRIYMNAVQWQPGFNRSMPAFLHPLKGLVLKLLKFFNFSELLDWLLIDKKDDALTKWYEFLSGGLVYQPKTVNFRISYHCNINCRHCYNHSGPSRKNDMLPFDEMIRIIREMPKANIARLTLTGGEPFLHLDLVKKLIKEARSNQIKKISIFSNGFWAHSTQNAEKVLNSLKKAGFMAPGYEKDRIKISGGVYHQEYITQNTIFNAVDAYHNIFKKNIDLDFESHHEGDGVKNQFIKALTAKNLDEKVNFRYRNISPIGRAAKNISKAEFKQKNNNSRPCKGINQIVFDPCGKATPCCGLTINNPGVTIGHINESLGEITARIRNDSILQYIQKKPLIEMFTLRNIPPPLDNTSDCYLCERAFSGQLNREELQLKLLKHQDFYPFSIEEIVSEIHPATVCVQ
jgi:organic radical activating enzyme